MIDQLSIDDLLGKRSGTTHNMDLCLCIEPFGQATLLAHLAQQQITRLAPTETNFRAESDGLVLVDTHDLAGNMIEFKGLICARA